MMKYSFVIVILSLYAVDSSPSWTVKPYPFYNPNYGNDLEMSCIVNEPFKGFYFKSKKIENGAHYAISSTSSSQTQTKYTLRIISVVDEDFGEYYCNDSDASVKADLHIQASIPELLSEQKVAIGFEGKIRAAVYGMPRNIITWEHSKDSGKSFYKIAELNEQGAQIFGENRFMILPKGELIIKSVALEDSGIYQVVTQSGSAGSIKRSTIVIAGYKPELQSPILPMYTITQGLNLTIPCEWKYLSGNPEWLFTGLSGSTTMLTSGFDSKALTLLNVTPDNIGNYTCKAKNAFGNMSVGTRLSEVIIPPTITTDFKNESRAKGSTYNLTCEASGTPIPTVTLFKADGIQLKTGQGNVVYAFSSLSLSDRGGYKCVADNGAKSITDMPAVATKNKHLDILTKPSIYVKETTTSISSAVGLSFVIKCTAGSNPLPKVELLRNSVAIQTRRENRTGYVTSYFEVVNATERDFGDVTCVASNSQGRNETLIQVNRVMKAPPPTGVTNAEPGFEYIDFSWKNVEGADSYIVYVNGSINQESTVNSITIKGLRRNTFYVFAVASVNIAGVGNASEPPIILKTSDIIKPDVIDKLITVSKTSSEINIAWAKPTNIEDAEVIIYTIKWCEINNTTGLETDCNTRDTKDTRFDLNKLKPATKYLLTVVATNQRVLGKPFQQFIQTDTAPTKPPLPSNENKGGLSASAVAGIIIVVILIILILVDLSCCYFNHCGFSHCCFETLCASKTSNKYAPADSKEEELKDLKSDTKVV